MKQVRYIRVEVTVGDGFDTATHATRNWVALINVPATSPEKVNMESITSVLSDALLASIREWQEEHEE